MQHASHVILLFLTVTDKKTHKATGQNKIDAVDENVAQLSRV